MIFTVAIDGPAAAGKGTISRAVARRFGLAHLDTGLLYRAVGARGGDPVAAARGLSAADLERDDLRTLAAGQAASPRGGDPGGAGGPGGVPAPVCAARGRGGAGRARHRHGDLPEAEVKLYVTASAEVRAHRRWLEVGGDEAQVLAEVRERDARDMGRADAPLKAAEDAVMIDTSLMAIARRWRRPVRWWQGGFGERVWRGSSLHRRVGRSSDLITRRYCIHIDGVQVWSLRRGVIPDSAACTRPGGDRARIDWCFCAAAGGSGCGGRTCVVRSCQ